MCLSELISKAQISEKINVLSKQLNEFFADKEKPVLLCVLQGAKPFFDQLTQKLNFEFDQATIQVRSYVGTRSSGNIEVVKPIGIDLTNRFVLIVEDIVDTGHTLTFLKQHLQQLGAAKVSVCTLLQKKLPQTILPKPDYVGFYIPDVFVVGFGLDKDGQYRDLPHILEIKSI